MIKEPTQRVSLKAGEEATLDTAGVVTVALVEGAAEIAAVSLQVGKEVSFNLVSGGARRVSVCSSGGCTITVTFASGIGNVSKAPTGALQVVHACRKALATQPSTKVLCVGDRGCGKSYACAVITNFLAKSANHAVVLLDADVSANTLCAGFVSARFVSAEEPRWPGYTALDSSVPIGFFVGESAISPDSLDLYFHAVEQANACAQWLAKSRPGKTSHVIVDAPSAPAGVDESLFQKRLIDVVRPSHVIIIGDKDQFTALQEDVSRQHTNVNFIRMPPLCVNSPYRGPKTALAQVAIEEYFIGPIGSQLGVVKAVAKLSDVKLHQVAYSAKHGGVAASAALSGASALRPGMVCSVSHASVVQEVPFANSLGAVIVSDVDAEHDELTLIVPSGDTKIPRAFFCVPQNLRYEGKAIDAIAI